MGEEIEISPAMIEAGVMRAKDFKFGASLAELVEAIYLAMEIERSYDRPSASVTNPSK